MYNKTGFPSHYLINLQSTAAMTVLCLYSPGNSTRSKPDISDSNTWEEKNSKQTAFVRSNKVKRKKKGLLTQALPSCSFEFNMNRETLAQLQYAQ